MASVFGGAFAISDEHLEHAITVQQHSIMEAEAVKCLCVGDSEVGKTCMLITYTTDDFPREFQPKVFEISQANVMIDGKKVSLTLWDTNGHEDFDNIRPPNYFGTDVFIVCYSVVSPKSFEHVEKKWLPEIRSICPNSPFLLVGTKSDLKDKNENANACSPSDGIAVLEQPRVSPQVALSHAKEKGVELGASRVMECSATTQVGLEEVFHEAIRVTLAARAKQTNQQTNNKANSGTCTLL